MSKCSITEAINEFKKGKMLILMDDEARENEGDLIIPAENITPEIINFMMKHGRGLICLAMAQELVNKLNLPLMTQNNRSNFGTNFTISIEARTGIATGISAFDRAKTVLTAIDDHANPESIVSPGHIFPLRSLPGGVLERRGQTEGSVDLAKLAGKKSAAVICEIVNNNGTMARFPDLEKFAVKHHLKIATIDDLAKYRFRYDKTILNKITETKLPTQFGEFKLIAYESLFPTTTHLALIKGKITKNKSTLVRIHSECLTGDVFGSMRCDCGEQLTSAMEMIGREDGVLLYMRQEGRGIGLSNKLKAYNLQDKGSDTVSANKQLGFAADLRDYGICTQILDDLGVRKINLLTNNPQKISGLTDSRFIIKRSPLIIKSNRFNEYYLKTKRDHLRHLLGDVIKEVP